MEYLVGTRKRIFIFTWFGLEVLGQVYHARLDPLALTTTP